MVTCAVARCKNSSAKSKKCKDGITFHRFPQDEQRRKKWEIAVNREAEWTSTESSSVCSEHFEAKDFYYTESGLRRLLIDAAPSINISPCEDKEPTISNIEPVDIKPTDTEEVIKLKHKVRRLEVIAANRKKQINIMWLEKKRMQKKLVEIKSVVQHLVQNQTRKKEMERGNT